MYEHRTNTPLWTEAQADAYPAQVGARFVKTEGQVSWWKLADGTFLGVKKLGNGYAEVRRMSADACGCK